MDVLLCFICSRGSGELYKYTNGVNMQLNAYFQLFRQLKSVNNKR